MKKWLRAVSVLVLMGLAFLIEPYIPGNWRVFVVFNLGVFATFLTPFLAVLTRYK